MSPARRQARIAVCVLAILVIVLATIFEPPGTVEIIGYLVVVAVLVSLVQRERKRLKAGE